ncbi:MAG: AMP-binding protein [candidate division Zixibacteria bacterium]|nr:AMP-binding protein [candidate division Zixibacteria bacterium]
MIVAQVSETIFDRFLRSAELYEDTILFKADGGRGQSYTYSGVKERVQRLSAGLMSDSYIDQPEIGLLSENRPEWGIAYLAILAAGKTVVPIDSNLKENEIMHIVRHSGIKSLFIAESFEPLFQKMEKSPSLFVMSNDSDQSWSRLESLRPSTRNISRQNVAVLIYTSGTTGSPKVVMLTHANILHNLQGISQAIPFDRQDIFLSILPLHHTFEATCGFLTPLMAGASIVFARSLKSKEILEDISANGITVMCGVPLLYDKMYHSMMRSINAAPTIKKILFKVLFFISGAGWGLGLHLGKPLFSSLRKKAGLQSIRMFVSGGAALHAEVARFFNFIGFDFFQGYGMTECSPVISMNKPGDIKFGSVGKPLPNLEVRMEPVGDSDVGEILIRGGSVTPGYKDNPGLTKETVRDGWLHSGDLGCFRGGHLWITGRAKNVIISSAGKNIYPEELEEKLLASPYVMEVVVVGRTKSGKQGEEPVALIIPDIDLFSAEFGEELKGDMGTIRKVISGVVSASNQQLSDYKRIADFEIQLSELEKTSTKKIKRHIYANRFKHSQ